MAQLKAIGVLTLALLFFFVTTSFAISARDLDENLETPTAGAGTVAVVPVVSPAGTQQVSAPSIVAGAVTPAPVTPAPAITQPAGTNPVASSGDHPLTFFMHDVLGGSNPSAQAVTGIVANTALNGQLAFAKPNGGVPLTNGVNNNAALLPFLTGLGGNGALVQNNINGNIAGKQVPFMNAGQLPDGTNIQTLEFGTITVIDDELTEGHELGSKMIGKAQGFYVVSSEDGSSQTMAFTAMLESGDYMDSLSFFGVHRTAVSESHLAVIGGTGKYQKAKGYATVQTLPPVDQHATDGVETLLQCTVYVSY